MQHTLFSIGLIIALFIGMSNHTFAGHKIGGVARIKGQERTVISGVGIVTGLNGKGDKPDVGRPFEMLEKMLEMSGHSGATSRKQIVSKHVALVRVNVTIPAEGSREGDELDCNVTALGNAASLEGGRLEVTWMLGVVPGSIDGKRLTYGFAQGPITIEAAASPTTAIITRGCRLTSDFTNPYIEKGCITLVLDQRFARMPRMSIQVANAINDKWIGSGDGDAAKAIDLKSVTIKMPKEQLMKDPMMAIADLMTIEIESDDNMSIPTVRINERLESIVIDEAVEIEPVALSIKGIDISPDVAAGPGGQAVLPPQRFVPLDVPSEMTEPPGRNIKLRALYNALNKVKVPAKDIIGIIKELDKSGRIIGVVEYD